MARCKDAFWSLLVRMRNVATCHRDDVVQEVQPIPSRTQTPEGRRERARSSSRRRRTCFGGRGSRSKAARTEVVEGLSSSSEDARAESGGQGKATSAPRGGGMYEV